MINRLKNNQSMFVAGHRGVLSLYPENTLLGFQKAIEIGVDMIEFDLRLSKDNIVMIMHDETLERTTNGTGNLCDYTLSELKQLDAGRWFGKPYEGLKIPTFEELCDLLTDYPEVLLNVEVKKGVQAKEVVDKAISMLETYGYISRCVFTCFDAEIVAYIHDTYHLKTQGFPSQLMSNFVAGEKGTYSKMWAVGIRMNLLTLEIVKEFRDKEILIWGYCPDDERQVFYQLGCDVKTMTCNDPRSALRIRRLLEMED